MSQYFTAILLRVTATPYRNAAGLVCFNARRICIATIPSRVTAILPCDTSIPGGIAAIPVCLTASRIYITPIPA